MSFAMSDKRNSISIVVPVYNSENIIFELHRRLTEALSAFMSSYEIVLVNDCSSDNSWAKISQIAALDHHVKAICLRKNVGYDNAVMAGLKYARHAFIVIMDDDLQYAPEEIQHLYGEIQKGYDVVYGDLLKKQDSLVKRMGSWFNGKIAQLIVKKPVDIYLCPFKILRKEIGFEIVKYQGPFPYVDGLIFQVTSSIGQVKVTHHKRAAGEGGHGAYKSIGIMLNFCTTFSILPLRLSTLTGFFMAFFAGIFSVILILWKLFFEIDVEGWASIMLGIAAIGGIQLLSVGILGEYVGRAYMNISSKPQYVVKNILGIDLENSTPPCIDEEEKNEL